MFQRKDRVSSLIQEELSKIIAREVEFPPGVLVTIISVDVDKKMDRAIVWVSVLPSAKAELIVGVLEKKAKWLTHLLLKKLNIKPMPDLMFRVDRGYEKAAEIEKVFMENEDGL